MIILRNLLLFSTLFSCFQAWGFEKEHIKYEIPSDPSNSINISFFGKVFKDPLDVWPNNNSSRRGEYQEFIDFFKLLVKKNRQGSLSSLLSAWHSDDHESISSIMNKDLLRKNTSKFQNLTAMKLKLIIRYGEFYICFLELDFEGGSSFVMKFLVGYENEKLVLSNALIDDYFYSLVSDYLAGSDYKHFLKEETKIELQ